MKIAPSILSADFANLERDVKLVEQAGADYIHVDVMDGQFVPNITLGPNVVKALRPVTKLPLDVHLMIVNPENYIEDFAKAGSDIITIHVESTNHIHRALQLIRSCGSKAGIVLNPGTSVAQIEPILDLVDLVLVMTVNPGFGGQSFIDSTLAKIEAIANLRTKHNYNFEIEVDGGINPETARKCLAAGAEVFVAGSYIYDSSSPSTQIKALKEVAE